MKRLTGPLLLKLEILTLSITIYSANETGQACLKNCALSSLSVLCLRENCLSVEKNKLVHCFIVVMQSATELSRDPHILKLGRYHRNLQVRFVSMMVTCLFN